MKILLTLLTVCLTISPLAAQDVPSRTRTLILAAGVSQVVTMAPNESLIIEMISNPSTGYRWDANQSTLEKPCYIMSEVIRTVKQSESSVPVVVGAPVSQQWSLRLNPEFVCPTGQELSWTYHRPWEPRSTQDPTVTLTVRSTDK